VIFRVLLDSNGVVQNVTIYDAQDQAAAGIELEPGGQLTPYVFVPSSSSIDPVLSTQTIRVTPNLGVAYPQLPEGTPFDMGVIVVDVSGGVDGSFVHETVPEGRTR
jgi:hypothetical protein